MTNARIIIITNTITITITNTIAFVMRNKNIFLSTHIHTFKKDMNLKKRNRTISKI